MERKQPGSTPLVSVLEKERAVRPITLGVGGDSRYKAGAGHTT